MTRPATGGSHRLCLLLSAAVIRPRWPSSSQAKRCWTSNDVANGKASHAVLTFEGVAVHQQGRPIAKSSGELHHTQAGYLGGSQLQRERNPTKVLTDLRQRSRVLIRDGKPTSLKIRELTPDAFNDRVAAARGFSLRSSA